MQSEGNEGLVKRNVTQTSIRSSTQAAATVVQNRSHVSTCSSAFVNKALIRRGMTTKGISSKTRRNYCGFILGLSYLALASLAVAMVFTSSTAELKSLMFSEEYRPAGLLYWLVTTLEPKGRALLLWLEPMCFTSCEHRAEKVGLPSFGKAKGDEHRSQEFVKRACRLKRTKPNGANRAKLLLALEDGVILLIFN